MKMYIPKYSGGAGLWIYEGYKAAWTELGYEVVELEDLKKLPNPEGKYSAMLTDGGLDTSNPEYYEKFLSNAQNVYLFVQPTIFPKPWGVHPNFISTTPKEFQSFVNNLTNVYLWTFSNTHYAKGYMDWKTVT